MKIVMEKNKFWSKIKHFKQQYLTQENSKTKVWLEWLDLIPEKISQSLHIHQKLRKSIETAFWESILLSNIIYGLYEAFRGNSLSYINFNTYTTTTLSLLSVFTKIIKESQVMALVTVMLVKQNMYSIMVSVISQKNKQRYI